MKVNVNLPQPGRYSNGGFSLDTDAVLDLNGTDADRTEDQPEGEFNLYLSLDYPGDYDVHGIPAGAIRLTGTAAQLGQLAAHLAMSADINGPKPTATRPWVVAFLDGGLVQDYICVPGVGDPTFDTLDFDREGETPEETREFIDYARPMLNELAELGFDVSGWVEDLDRMEEYAKERET